MIKAVITGDIIQSSRLKPEVKAELTKVIRARLSEMDKQYSMKSELFRGDSFQCLIDNPKMALRICLLIKTYIKKFNPSEIFDIYTRENSLPIKTVLNTKWMFDVRLAIGIGMVDLEMETVSTSDGEAFRLSGRLLDEMKNNKQTIAIATADSFHGELETEFILLDSIISKATALQCEVVYHKLMGTTEIKIANELNIQQSAVNQRSNSAGWNAIDKMVKRFESIYG